MANLALVLCFIVIFFSSVTPSWGQGNCPIWVEGYYLTTRDLEGGGIRTLGLEGMYEIPDSFKNACFPYPNFTPPGTNEECKNSYQACNNRIYTAAMLNVMGRCIYAGNTNNCPEGRVHMAQYVWICHQDILNYIFSQNFLANSPEILQQVKEDCPAPVQILNTINNTIYRRIFLPAGEN
jgi:hypothetical protein